jgi:hypothetical protein
MVHGQAARRSVADDRLLGEALRGRLLASRLGILARPRSAGLILGAGLWALLAWPSRYPLLYRIVIEAIQDAMRRFKALDRS